MYMDIIWKNLYFAVFFIPLWYVLHTRIYKCICKVTKNEFKKTHLTL